MKNRAALFSALLIAAVAAIVAWLFLFRSALHVSGPLRHEAYVWQRAWTEPVRSAVAQHATNFASLVVLKAEVSWKGKQPQVARVALDYPTLARALTNSSPHGRADLPVGHAARQRVPAVGLALRIGPYSGPFTAPAEETHPIPLSGGERDGRRSNAVPLRGGVRGGSDSALQNITGSEAVTTFLCDLAASLVAEARTHHVNVSELQIDFDCAESKLDGYRLWVEAIQKRVAPLPVTITALPSWLNASAFKRLAAVATNYVLQVHSLARPADIHAPFTLCDPRAAKRAVQSAGQIGVPFRVALPTYAYVIAFDQTGKFIGLSAEGPRRNWPEGTQLREIRSDPLAMAALVQMWTTLRPAAMRGVIWYRLPVTVDNFNWRWPTLGAMLAARSPREVLRVEPRRVEPGLMEVSLVNDGELDISSRLAVEVRWSDARLVAGDGLRDFELAAHSASAARFQTKSNSIRLPAGDSLKLGWLRFDRDCEVRCELKKL